MPKVNQSETENKCTYSGSKKSEFRRQNEKPVTTRSVNDTVKAPFIKALGFIK
jgi:hypothetical protein